MNKYDSCQYTVQGKMVCDLDINYSALNTKQSSAAGGGSIASQAVDLLARLYGRGSGSGGGSGGRGGGNMSMGPSPARFGPAGLSPAGLSPAGLSPAGLNPAGQSLDGPVGFTPAALEGPAGFTPAAFQALEGPAGFTPAASQPEMFTQGIGMINRRPNEQKQNSTIPASVIERALRYGKVTHCKTVNTPTGPIMQCNKNIS